MLIRVYLDSAEPGVDMGGSVPCASTDDAILSDRAKMLCGSPCLALIQYACVLVSSARVGILGGGVAPRGMIFLRSCADRDFSCHGVAPGSDHCKKNIMRQPVPCPHSPPARKHV